MPSTPETPAESNPSAVSFAEKRDTTDTRWGAGVVAAIIAAIALVAAGVTAAVVLSNKPASSTPPEPALPSNITQSRAAGGPFGDLRDVKLMSWTRPLAGAETLMAAGKTVKLGDSGVSFDVASGWEVGEQDKNFVGISNSSSPGSFLVWYGVVKSDNAGDVLTQNFQDLTGTDGMSNVKATKADGGDLKDELQKNFDQIAFNQFSADITTQQGSGKILGESYAFLNTGKNSQIKTPAGFSTFVVMFSKDEASYKEVLPDLKAMLEGIIGASPTT
jgi:hypothetical protein